MCIFYILIFNLLFKHIQSVIDFQDQEPKSTKGCLFNRREETSEYIPCPKLPHRECKGVYVFGNRNKQGESFPRQQQVQA